MNKQETSEVKSEGDEDQNKYTPIKQAYARSFDSNHSFK
jgi:hypothetical protein